MTCTCCIIGGTVAPVRCHAVEGGRFSEKRRFRVGRSGSAFSASSMERLMLSFQGPHFESQRSKNHKRNCNALVIRLYSALMIILSFFFLSVILSLNRYFLTTWYMSSTRLTEVFGIYQQTKQTHIHECLTYILLRGPW